MNRCEYFDAGWCYAPVDVKTNDLQGECVHPEYCPYLKSQKKMTEIQQTKEDIAVLQEKLKKLEELEIQKSKTPIEKAYYTVYNYYPLFDTDGYDGSRWNGFLTGYYAGYEEAVKNNKNFEPTPQTPEQVEQGLRDAMKQAKEDGVFDKPETLYEAITNLGYCEDYCNQIVDAVRCWLPKEQSAKGSQNVYVECTVEGFNDCLKKIKSKLR